MLCDLWVVEGFAIAETNCLFDLVTVSVSDPYDVGMGVESDGTVPTLHRCRQAQAYRQARLGVLHLATLRQSRTFCEYLHNIHSFGDSGVN
jgi:hypothetical protein